MIIYKITNLIDGKVYIGQTICTLEKRWYEHCWHSGKDNLYLHQSIQKYGLGSFKVEQLAKAANQEQLDYLETYFIVLYDSNNREIGYNLTNGGDHGPDNRGRKHSQETRQKHSKLMLGNKYALGFEHSLETRLKVSQGLVGNKNRLGILHPLEMKDQIAESVKRAYQEGRHRKMTEIERQALIARNKSRVWTPEMRAKIAAANSKN